MPGHPICTHGRLPDGCEDCAYVAAMERGAPVAPRPDRPEVPEPELADADLYLDQGDGRFTYVRAGDAIPAHLTQLARHPRAGAPQAAPGPVAEPQSRGKVAPKGNASPAAAGSPELWTGGEGTVDASATP